MTCYSLAYLGVYSLGGVSKLKTQENLVKIHPPTTGPTAPLGVVRTHH